MGHVEYHLVVGFDRDHREGVLYSRTALAEHCYLSRDGMVVCGSCGPDACSSARVGLWLADRRWRDLHARRNCIRHKDIQFCPWCVRLSRDVAYFRDACRRSTFCGCSRSGDIVVKKGDIFRIEYIRPGKEVTYYEEDFLAQDDISVRTFKTLPDDISAKLSAALVKQQLIQPHQIIGTISKTYFFAEPFNLLEFRDRDGALLGYYSDIGEPAIHVSENEIRMTDLFLDIWLYPDGKLLELDWDEFEEAVGKKVISSTQAQLARNAMQRLITEVDQGIYPTQYANHFNI